MDVPTPKVYTKDSPIASPNIFISDKTADELNKNISAVAEGLNIYRNIRSNNKIVLKVRLRSLVFADKISMSAKNSLESVIENQELITTELVIDKFDHDDYIHEKISVSKYRQHKMTGYNFDVLKNSSTLTYDYDIKGNEYFKSCWLIEKAKNVDSAKKSALNGFIEARIDGDVFINAQTINMYLNNCNINGSTGHGVYQMAPMRLSRIKENYILPNHKNTERRLKITASIDGTGDYGNNFYAILSTMDLKNERAVKRSPRKKRI